jgi:hypothetical protein
MKAIFKKADKIRDQYFKPFEEYLKAKGVNPDSFASISWDVLFLVHAWGLYQEHDAKVKSMAAAVNGMTVDHLEKILGARKAATEKGGKE